MRSLWRAARVRGLVGVLVTALVLAGAGWVMDTMSLPIRFVSGNPTYRMPLVELTTLVGAVVLTSLTRPRLWHWERLGPRRPRVLATTVAIVGMGVAQIPILVVFLGSTEIRWGWLLANGVLVAAAVFAVSPLLGPILGGNLVLALYLVNGVLFNAVPGIADVLPVVGFDSRAVIVADFPTSPPEAHWWLAVGITLVAVWSHWATIGATDRWATRTGND